MGAIELRDVSFCYRDNETSFLALEHIDLKWVICLTGSPHGSHSSHSSQRYPVGDRCHTNESSYLWAIVFNNNIPSLNDNG